MAMSRCRDLGAFGGKRAALAESEAATGAAMELGEGTDRLTAYPSCLAVDAPWAVPGV